MKSKEQKRAEAEERNTYWAELSPTKQLADLDRRGLTAAKQRLKIKTLIDAQTKPKQEETKGE